MISRFFTLAPSNGVSEHLRLSATGELHENKNIRLKLKFMRKMLKPPKNLKKISKK